MDNQKEFEELIKERFSLLPGVVQSAIQSASIQKNLRTLADQYKLHLDQWELLENEVMLTLLAIHPIENLSANIQKDVEVDQQTADAIAAAISETVFEPIRKELERELEHPEAETKEVSGVEQLRTQTLDAHVQPPPTGVTEAPVAPLPAPQTPQSSQLQSQPPPAQPAKPTVMRAPISENYKPQVSSAGRKEVHDDPYREPLS